MSIVELYVGLKIPDTTAITTFHLLKRMGYDISKVKRQVYYKFEIEGDATKFAEKISKVDILVNANKNNFSMKIEKDDPAVHVLVKDRGDKCEFLISTLKDRFDFSEIINIEKGILWYLYIDSKKKEKIAKEIADVLLHNENYQGAKILNNR